MSLLLNQINSNFPHRAMPAIPISQERRTQIVKVIFISLLLDLVSMAALYQTVHVSMLIAFRLDLLHLYLATFP